MQQPEMAELIRTPKFCSDVLDTGRVWPRRRSSRGGLHLVHRVRRPVLDNTTTRRSGIALRDKRIRTIPNILRRTARHEPHHHHRRHGDLLQRCLRSAPVVSCRHPCAGWTPRKNERPHPFGSPYAEHPIHHHVAGPKSVDPDKAGRRHARRRLPHHIHSPEAAHDLNMSSPRLPANRVCGGPSPASRSFVLAALRALHLDPD